MRIELIHKREVTPAEWDGGKTWELFIFPKEAKYADRDFDFRISTASIEKSPSTFTRFKGYRRFLVMLTGDLHIIRNGEKESVKHNQVFKFSSDDEIDSYSSGQDFNLMVKEDKWISSVEVSKSGKETGARLLFVFAMDDCEVLCNEESFQLNGGDCLVIDNNEMQLVNLKADKEIILGVLNETF